MNYNKTSDPEHRWRIIAFILFCLLLVGGIVYMKHSSGEQKTLNAGSSENPDVSPVAIPDTTVSTELLPAEPDTVISSVLPDTVLGKDKRVPYEAGYEDGYAAGCDDGATGQENATYDETNSFKSSAEQQDYVRGYREGYAKGLDDGKHGKQFNI